MTDNETNQTENTQRKQPSKVGKIITIIAATILVISLTLGIILLFMQKKEADDNKEIEEEYVYIIDDTDDTDITDTGDEEVINKKNEEKHIKEASEEKHEQNDDSYDDIMADYDGLINANSDYIGWIHIPIGISYPIVQGDDNFYYIHTNFNKKYAYSGAIMLSSLNSPDLTDRNSVIYGHNMANGTMFGLLHKLKRDSDLIDQNPYFFIHIKDGYYTYEIFSMQSIYKKNQTFNTIFTGDEAFSEYLDNCKSQSMYWKDGLVNEKSRVVSLSTCNGRQGTSNRLVVQGVLKYYTGYDGTRLTYDEILAKESGSEAVNPGVTDTEEEK